MTTPLTGVVLKGKVELLPNLSLLCILRVFVNVLDWHDSMEVEDTDP